MSKPKFKKIHLVPLSDSGHICAVACGPSGPLEPLVRASTPPPASLVRVQETDYHLPALRLAALEAASPDWLL